MWLLCVFDQIRYFLIPNADQDMSVLKHGINLSRVSIISVACLIIQGVSHPGLIKLGEHTAAKCLDSLRQWCVEHYEVVVVTTTGNATFLWNILSLFTNSEDPMEANTPMQKGTHS